MNANEYNKAINKLFSDWITEHKNDEKVEKDSFWCDGIIDFNSYSNAKLKILFIAKEANAENQEASSEHSCLDWYNNLIYPENYTRRYPDRARMREKIGRMAYYLLKMSSKISEEKRRTPTQEEYIEALKSIAIMNINKRGGNSSANYDRLKEYIEDYGEYIKTEIEKIEPNIIVCLGSYNLLKDLIDDMNIKIIDMWHTGIWGKALKKHDTAPKYIPDNRNTNRYMNEFFERVKKIK